jgi:arylsulfatase A-like enzyme
MLDRRELLRRAAAIVPGVLLGRAAVAAAEPTAPAAGAAAAAAIPPDAFRGRNVVLFITDQERAVQHFPAGWAQRNLPGHQRLVQHGVSFDDAVCNACMCSPSRATLLTGRLPAHHGVKFTLEEDMPDDRFPQVALEPSIPNLATTMAAAGYDVVFKGKFHLCKPAGDAFAPSDLLPYGFTGWNPPDAGANQDVEQEGGGVYDNDGRYMTGADGVLPFLAARQPGDRPFCLIVSLVNPHDVLLYPKNQAAGGYDGAWLDGEVPLPATVNESLATKPSVQRRFRALFGATGALKNAQMKRDYINFYANLMKHADGMLVQVLDALDAQGLTDSTVVVRTSDHGEMGLAHGGLRQKNFNAYEETLRVPLVFSNPQLFPAPRRSDALVSHVDFLPTLAALFGGSRVAGSQGVDYSRVVRGTSTRSPQEHTVFTFDDVQAGQARGPYLKAPNRVVALREKRWKIAETFDGSGQQPSEWELYDRLHDPNERHNLAHRGVRRTREQQRAWVRLQRTLAQVKRTQLQPAATTPQPQVSA